MNKGLKMENTLGGGGGGTYGAWELYVWGRGFGEVSVGEFR